MEENLVHKVGQEKEISMGKKINWGKGALAVLFLFFLVNLLFLDFYFFKPKKPAVSPLLDLQAEPSSKESTEIALSEPRGEKETLCPAACLDLINKSASQEVEAAEKEEPASGLVSCSAPKEVYIPLGKGSTTSLSWQELVGVEAVIDLANYPQLKSVIFEASMRIPTANGKAYAKLYNVTDKHDVWGSEVWAEGPSGYRAEAKNLSLSSGRKVYRLMMKSTMGYEAILDSARLKILLE